MMHTLRSAARVAQRAVIARPAVQRSAVAVRAVAPVRAFSFTACRWAPAVSSKASENAPEDLPAGWPAGVARRVDETGVGWVDYRPENLRNITAERNDDGDLVGRFDGEDVIFPDLEPTLEWVLSTPVDVHLFEESPIIKSYEEEQADHPEMGATNVNSSARA